MQDELSAPAQFMSLLPSLSNEERQQIDSVPDQFRLNVPYFIQEEKHWSGAAVAQMILAYNSDYVPPQKNIAADANLDGWQLVNHETLKEDFARYMARKNFFPAMYYPGRYVLPKYKTGIEGADFIAANFEMVNAVGFKYLKALMVKDRCPIMVRVHFHTGMYPMAEDMAAALDTCGHALLVVGYDLQGFYVHDPWDKGKWGGTHGGKDFFITYEELAQRPTVNCCLGQESEYAKLHCEIDYPRLALIPNRDVEIILKVRTPGIFGITSDIYSIEGLSAELQCAAPLSAKGANVVAASREIMASGMATQFTWQINTGPEVGSYPIEVLVKAPLRVRGFAWEKNASDELIVLSSVAKRRLDIKDEGWINRYGRE